MTHYRGTFTGSLIPNYRLRRESIVPKKCSIGN